MTKIKLKYIQRYRDRHGKMRHYLRRPGRPRVLLPDPGDPDFGAAYAKALDVSRQEKKSEAVRNFRSLVKAWQAGPRFRQLREATQVNYRRVLNRLEAEDFSDHMVVDFEQRHVRRFVARLVETPAAANTRLKLFRMLFEHAIELGWRDDNPAVNVKRMKEKQIGAASWTEAQIAAYEAHWPSGTIQRLAFALLLYTGQRRSDIVKMGARHIVEDTLEVVQQKTGTRLFIPIHECLRREIEFAGTSHPFLQTSQGKPFTANGFYMRFKSWRAAAGLPDGLSPHGLRKAAARRLAEAGCTAHEIAAITGHASLAEVQRYTRAADQRDLAKKAVARIKSV